MSVAQLLKHFRELPRKERDKFIESALEIDSAPQRRKKVAKKRPVKWPDIVERAKKIFGDRKLPNLVLMAREEERH